MKLTCNPSIRIYQCLTLVALCLASARLNAQQVPLSGTVLSNDTSETGSSVQFAFDGSEETFFSSGNKTGIWVGLDLGTAHTISRIGYLPRQAKDGPDRMLLGVFEGANCPDFSDALPLGLIAEAPALDGMTYADVSLTAAVRYVRYKGPQKSGCEVSELAFYGVEGNGGTDKHYDPLTNLPIISIHIENDAEPIDKVNELNCIVSVISADGHKLVQDTATIRQRGNFSRTLPKTPYRIKFASKTKLLGSPAKAKKWTLIPSYGDKTLMRNMLSFEISRRVGLAYTPFCTPVNVLVNGEYKGCYQLCDQVEVHKDRIEIEKMDSTCMAGEDLTGGYFIEIDAHAGEEPCWFNSAHGNPVTIKYPDSDDILSEQKNYIREHFNKMENAVYDHVFDPESGYRRYLDMASFTRHFLLEEFVGNTDTYWSVFMYKQRGDEHLYTGPVWDLDLTFDNDGRTYPIDSRNAWIYSAWGSYAGQMRTFVNHLMADPSMQHQLQSQWATLRQTRAIDVEELDSIIDAYALLLDQSQDLNFKRWPIMNTKVHENPVIWGSYAAEVDNVRNYVASRVARMDDFLSCAADDYQLTISDAGWATLYIPFSAAVPSGLTAYRVMDISEECLVREEVAAFEANKPYLVKGAPGLYTISGFRVPGWDKQELGLLRGTIQEMAAPVGSYVLQNQNGIVRFYPVMDEADGIPTISAQKAYLVLPTSYNGAPARYYDIDEVAGLNNHRTDGEDMLRIYALSGELRYQGLISECDAESVINRLPSGVFMIVQGSQMPKKVIRR